MDALALSTCAWPAGSSEHAAGARWLEQHPLGAGHANARPWNGGLGEEQRAWLAAELAAAERAGERAVVVSHLPVWAAASSATHLLWDHEEVLALLDRSPALFAWINGHDHRGGYAVRRGVHHWTLPGLVEAPADGNAYGVVSVYPERWEVRGHGQLESRVLALEPAPADEEGESQQEGDAAARAPAIRGA